MQVHAKEGTMHASGQSQQLSVDIGSLWMSLLSWYTCYLFWNINSESFRATHSLYFLMRHWSFLDKILLNCNPPSFPLQLPNPKAWLTSAPVLCSRNHHQLQQPSGRPQLGSEPGKSEKRHLIFQPGRRCEILVKLRFPDNGRRHLWQQAGIRLACKL